MAGSSRNASPIKRLMTELQNYQTNKNEVLYDLGPTDDDVMQWRAVMKGVPGTAYEGNAFLPPKHIPCCLLLTHTTRRLLAPLHLHPSDLPTCAAYYPLHNTHLPP